MGRAGLVLGIVASAVILIVGVQIIIAGFAYMPIVTSRVWSVRNVEVTGFPAFAMGMAWLCGGLAILVNLSSTRIAYYSSKLIALRNILLVLVGASYLIAVIGQIARVYGNSAF
jgi:hypothetical protein